MGAARVTGHIVVTHDIDDSLGFGVVREAVLEHVLELLGELEPEGQNLASDHGEVVEQVSQDNDPVMATRTNRMENLTEEYLSLIQILFAEVWVANNQGTHF